jgi:hypothetical protein
LRTGPREAEQRAQARGRHGEGGGQQDRTQGRARDLTPRAGRAPWTISC